MTQACRVLPMSAPELRSSIAAAAADWLAAIAAEEAAYRVFARLEAQAFAVRGELPADYPRNEFGMPVARVQLEVQAANCMRFEVDRFQRLLRALDQHEEAYQRAHDALGVPDAALALNEAARRVDEVAEHLLTLNPMTNADSATLLRVWTYQHRNDAEPDTAALDRICRFLQAG